MVKVTDTWPTRHLFVPITTEDPPFSGGRCTLNMSRLKRAFRRYGTEVRRGGYQLRCRPRHLILVQNYEVDQPKVLE
ncbi:hypothetical protein TNCV_97871 [Trichonephila clavipes]|nr:hypothetical protein TNCV_97871 [Trichonephila clavipes]